MTESILLPQLIAESAARRPQALALTMGGDSMYYAQLADAVTRFSGGLVSLGLCRGERVAIYLEKRFEVVSDRADLYCYFFERGLNLLKPGGRLAVSDVVALGPIPEKIQKDALALAGCVAGAADVKTLEDMLRAVGFEQVSVVVKPESREFIQDWLPGSGAEEYVASANITAQKPKSRGCC